MAKINLRAWREERDEEAQKTFSTSLLLTVIIAGAVVFLLGMYLDQQVQRQNLRNTFMQSEINLLKTKIKEIENLKKLKERRLARLNTIQTLQGNRPLIVRYYDELIRVLPEELYYTSMVRVGDKLTINGLANRNQDVSELMRNLNKSQWFGEPNLTKIGASELNRTFNLDVQLSRGALR
ncbi:MAG: PilN domain-containing protein [Oceanospirillaceae bacterium]|nr:PilN domain-containing protein [Oceanospirillaceae bacterium]